MGNRFIERLRGFVPLDVGDGLCLESLCRASRVYPAGCDIIREGDAPSRMLIILDGWACRYKLVPGGGRQIVALLIPGDCSNIQEALVSEMDHAISALTPVRAMLITVDQMHQVMEHRPAIARALWFAQLVDAAVLREWVVSMGRRSSTERVAHLMCELYVRMRNIGLAEGDRCEMPLTQKVLADALGLTSVHVNRVLRKFRLAGIMELNGGSLTIEAYDKLALIAGFDEGYLRRRALEIA